MFLILDQIACPSINFFLKILYCLFIKIWSHLHIDLFWLVLWLPSEIQKKKSRSCWCWFVNDLWCYFMAHCGQWCCSLTSEWSHGPSSAGEHFRHALGIARACVCVWRLTSPLLWRLPFFLVPCVGRWQQLWTTSRCFTAKEGSTKKPSRCVRELWRSERRCAQDGPCSRNTALYAFK